MIRDAGMSHWNETKKAAVHARTDAREEAAGLTSTSRCRSSHGVLFWRGSCRSANAGYAAGMGGMSGRHSTTRTRPLTVFDWARLEFWAFGDFLFRVSLFPDLIFAPGAALGPEHGFRFRFLHWR